MGEEQPIPIALQAICELYGLVEWAMVVYRHPEELIFSDHLAGLFETLRREQNRDAIAPAVAYLMHVPLLGGSGHTKSSYVPPKPDIPIIEKAVDFLAFMGDPRALSALQRLAWTQRNIPILLQEEEYEDSPNEQERAHAEWAIRMILAVQSNTYSICQSCNGEGRHSCINCKGSGKAKTKVMKRFLLWKWEMSEMTRCQVCYGAKIVECSNCGGFGKLLPNHG